MKSASAATNTSASTTTTTSSGGSSAEQVPASFRYPSSFEMIWYLLFPLRRTTRAPILSASHPLRRFFTRYGRQASRLSVSTLIISTAVATILIYPIPFLFTNDFINGASNLPHHVWTLARPIPYDPLAVPDIIMRSIWIHASYMQALDVDLLMSALDVQDELLGVTENFAPDATSTPAPPGPDSNPLLLSPHQRDSFHAVRGLTNQSWFFQSPLLYWNCSRALIQADTDIVATVNRQKNQSTSANLTLRHSIVFSGKRFEDRRLLAADALVITLLHLRDSPVGYQWDKMAPLLPDRIGEKWDIYPSDGHVTLNQLYEFQFEPISLQESISLAVAYGLTLLYFLLSLSNIRAVKSRIGLIATVLAQALFCILSSFTVCAVFNVDLSRIPRWIYPLLILSMSMENIFQFVNAVVSTPSEDCTSNRIGHAFGETAPIALASTMQRIVLGLGLSYIVSPGVSAICIFSVIATIFDFFFLSTFFLSVLSVDVRRMELGDALARESSRHNRRVKEGRAGPSLLKKLSQGNLVLSTRVAGTFVMIGFVVIAQWHFFGGKALFQRLISQGELDMRQLDIQTPRLPLLEDVHQARSPSSWLRLQDHNTAEEVIRIIKPSAYSYIARVYDPLVLVRKGSDRMPHQSEPTLLPAAYDFVHHQLATFIVIVLLVVAALRMLTSYLLLEDEIGLLYDDHDLNESPNIAIKSLSGGHSLDIALLAESSGRHLVSVGLDRAIRVWNLKDSNQSYAIARAGKGAGKELFPVLSVALDEDSRWLAILSIFQVTFWNLETRTWGRSMAVNTSSRRPEAFLFDHSVSPRNPRLVIVWKNGILTEIEVTTNEETHDVAICSPKFIYARPLLSRDNSVMRPRLSVLALSRQGVVHVTTRRDSSWETHEFLMSGLLDGGVHQLVALSPLSYFVIASTDKIHLIDADKGSVVHVFQVERMQPRSLECAFSTHRSSTFGSVGLAFFTLCYASAESGDCVLHQFSPQIGDDAICLRMSADMTIDGWCTWDAARELQKHMEEPGLWGLASDGSAVGLRRRSQEDFGSWRHSSLRLRKRFPGRDGFRDTSRCWEVWRMSIGDRTVETVETLPLFGQGGDDGGHLVISELGPKVNIGLMSIAFAFGNVIKVVTVGGHERFEAEADEAGRELSIIASGRRRKLGSLIRSRAFIEQSIQAL